MLSVFLALMIFIYLSGFGGVSPSQFYQFLLKVSKFGH